MEMSDLLKKHFEDVEAKIGPLSAEMKELQANLREIEQMVDQLNRLPSKRSTIVSQRPSKPRRETRRPPCSQATTRPYASSV